MMSDKLKDEEYFEKIISPKKENIIFYLNAFENNEVVSERKHIVVSSMAGDT